MKWPYLIINRVQINSSRPSRLKSMKSTSKLLMFSSSQAKTNSSLKISYQSWLKALRLCRSASLKTEISSPKKLKALRKSAMIWWNSLMSQPNVSSKIFTREWHFSKNGRLRSRTKLHPPKFHWPPIQIKLLTGKNSFKASKKLSLIWPIKYRKPRSLWTLWKPGWTQWSRTTQKIRIRLAHR